MSWPSQPKKSGLFTSFIKSPGKAFVRRKNGVSTIVRESYGRDSEWYALVAEIRKRDRYQCVFCQSKVKLGTHHLKPLSRGGTTTKSNLATICESCHKKRHKHL